MVARTFPLFEESPGKELSVAQALGRGSAGDKAQQRFRQLVAKIEKQRALLREWQDYAQRYNQRITAELDPVRQELRAARSRMALLLDEQLTQGPAGRRLGRVQRAKLQEILIQLLEDLLSEADDVALRRILEKYQDPPDEEEQHLEMEFTRSMLSGMMGLDIDEDHGASTPEELLKVAERKMQEEFEKARQAQEERQAKRGTRGKARTKKAREAQERREQTAKEVSQSLRAVFRKLVSALHPDREPDPQERQRKNELMQRVNRAYEANDLLTLLGLQLEIEQIDAEHLASITEERLAHYNQILREQLTDLESEIARFTQPFRMALGRLWGGRLTPAAVDRGLSEEIERLHLALQEVEEHQVAFQDPKRLRAILKDYTLEDDFDPFGDLDDLADFLRDLEPPPSPRRRRSWR